MKRFLSLILALLLVAFVAYSGRDTSAARLQSAVCLPKPTLMQRGTMLASDIGSIVPALNRPIPTEKIVQNFRGMWATAGYWVGVAGAAMDGRPAPEPVIEPVDCAALLDPCKDETAPRTAEPYDPKSASLTGPALAAAALRKAGFPADEIPTFVAIAKHETGFRNITGPTVGAGTMRGMWQLNDQYWKLPNWQDPYANARMAKRVRDEAVANGNSPYQPWSTRQAAIRDAGDYARYGTPTPAGGGGEMAAASVAPAAVAPRAPLTQDGETFAPDAPQCVPSTTGAGIGPATVGSWNVWYANTPSRINAGAGFADLVGLQEIRHNSALRVPGYASTPGRMAVPIIWRTSKLELVTWKRENSLRGYARDKSVVWAIFRNKQTGQKFAAINTHQLVEGGRGWDIQAAKVSAVRKRLNRQGLPVVLVGDMNASAPKIRAAFGDAGVGHNIDRIIAFGAKPVKIETLDYDGSDHKPIRATFADAPTSDNRANIIRKGSKYAGGSGEAGIRAMAKAHGAPFNPHTDPQGMTAADLTSSGEQNNALAEDLRAHHDELGLRYVISQMRIASPRENWAWRDYSPITNQGDYRHEGHVHVSY